MQYALIGRQNGFGMANPLNMHNKQLMQAELADAVLRPIPLPINGLLMAVQGRALQTAPSGP